MTWRTREELLAQLVVLHRQGMSARAISRALGISRNTTRALLAAHTTAREAEHRALPQKPERVPRASRTDPYASRVTELLGRYPDITAQRVFETLRDEGFLGGYTEVKKLVRRLRPPPKPAPSLTTPEYGPGEMSECDWSPYEVRYTSGERDEVNAFSYVLVYSHRKSVGLYRHADIYGLMDGHVRAFGRFGGCAHECIYDGQKSVVLRWEGVSSPLLATPGASEERSSARA
jgi:transposase